MPNDLYRMMRAIWPQKAEGAKLGGGGEVEGKKNSLSETLTGFSILQRG